MSGNENREVAVRACKRHNVTFNQARTRERSGQQWGPWFPPECPECTVETAQRLEREKAEQKWRDEVLPELKAEIIAESDRQCDAEAGRAERIRAQAEAKMPEVFSEWWALNLAGFIAREDSEDRAAKDAQIIARRKEQFFEQQAEAAAQAKNELEAALEARREQRRNESLSSWAMLG